MSINRLSVNLTTATWPQSAALALLLSALSVAAAEPAEADSNDPPLSDRPHQSR